MRKRGRAETRVMPRPQWDATLLRNIVDSSQDLIFAKDRNLHVIFCNETCVRVFGKRAAELYGKSEAEIGWAVERTDDGGRPKESLSERADVEALEGRAVFTPSERHRLAGGVRFFDVTHAPLRDSSGGVVGVVCTCHDVTSFHSAVEGLRDSAERYRALSEYAYEWEAWQDPEGHILYMSPSFERITGYPVADFTAEPLLINTIVHPDDRARYDAHRLHTLENAGLGAEPELEFRIVSRDGEEHWIAHSCQSVFRADGTYMGRRATNRDITEVKIAEEMLRTSEARFKSMFDDSPVGKSLIAIDGRLHVNRAFCEMLGYSEAELDRKTWVEVTPPEDLERTRVALKPLLEGKVPFLRMEQRLLHKSGRLIWADVITALHRDETGRPLHYMSTVTDISDRKRLDARLRLKAALFDTLRASNVILDETGVIVEMNDHLAAVWGCDRPDELTGRAFSILFADEAAAKEVAAALESRGSWAGELTARRIDSSTFTAHGVAASIRGPFGDREGYLMSIVGNGVPVPEGSE